jgi:hypothetical protein
MKRYVPQIDLSPNRGLEAPVWNCPDDLNFWFLMNALL